MKSLQAFATAAAATVVALSVAGTSLAQMMNDGKAMQSQMSGKGGMESHSGMGGTGQMPGMQGGPTMPMMMMQGPVTELPSDHVEGRIAYLHAELRISEAQMPAWTEFASVLRANAKRVADARPMSAQGANKPALDRLADQERWLTVRLESVRALKAAYGKLYAVLDDEQRKSADELVAPYFGMR